MQFVVIVGGTPHQVQTRGGDQFQPVLFGAAEHGFAEQCGAVAVGAGGRAHLADVRGVDAQVGLDQVMQQARKMAAAGAGNDFADLREEQVRIHRGIHGWVNRPGVAVG